MPEFDMNYAFLIVGILLTFAILASNYRPSLVPRYCYCSCQLVC